METSGRRNAVEEAEDTLNLVGVTHHDDVETDHRGLHPDGLAGQTLNFGEWATYLLGQMRRVQTHTADPRVADLVAEVEAYPTVTSLRTAGETIPAREPVLLVPWRLQLAGEELSLFTTLTTFGTPRDITLDELAVELFYPSDETTAAFLTHLAEP